ncbi:MAG: hypothetical protein QOJ90_454 [Actinomycetota bacterium]|nr:hypothetical protein [Actinomycetota bacterium]
MLVELAQNAADAARRAGQPGRLLLSLDGSVFSAANTGAPLDAAGVESLSTLRASAKRDDARPGPADDAGGTVGRFGVGFAAVLAVTDEPKLVSRSGAVRWSRSDTAVVVASEPALSAELARRGGHVPALRLPWATEGSPPDGYDSAVVLPLRDDAATALVRQLLDDLDDTLLLALPGLAEVVVEVDGGRRVISGTEGWHVVRRSGRAPSGLLADRPTEERGMTAAHWSLLWAAPRAGQQLPRVLYAPTPTDEPLDLPALLIAAFPLDPARRHVAPGPLTDFLVAEAGSAYAELAGRSDDPLALVPGPVAAGALDASLRAAATAALADAELLRTVDGSPLRPRDAVTVTGVGAQDPALAVLAEVLPGLVGDHRALDRLGTRRLAVTDVVDSLAEVGREPRWWWRLYDALAGTGRRGDALGALPVPLIDGRVVRGPRGVLLVSGAVPEGLGSLGLRIAHPAAAHPFLRSLGAVDATARTLLEDPAVRGAVEDLESAVDPGPLLDAVLGLVAVAEPAPGELPWLAALLLPEDTGEWAPAGDLALPDGLLVAVAEPDALGRPAPELLDRWGRDVLAAVGVADGFGIVSDADVVLDDTADHDLADEGDWVHDVLMELPQHDVPPLLTELTALRDLDLVRDDAWDVALVAIAADPTQRAAVVEPARAMLADGSRADLPSYSAWWLRRHALLGGRTPTACAAGPDIGVLAGLYDVVRTELDETFLAAIGVRTTLERLLAEPGGPDELLDRLAEPDRAVSAGQLVEVYTGLAALEPDRVSPPDRVRVAADEVVGADDAVVLDAPHHRQVPWPSAPLVVPLSTATRLADVLDIDTTSERLRDVTVASGAERAVAAPVLRVLPGAPATWQEHDSLVVVGTEVSWWVDETGAVHASTVDGLARGLSWAAGRWEQRLLVAAVLAEPDRVAELLAEAGLDGSDLA